MQWSSPDMVDEIYEYIPNLHGNHTLCYFMNDCRIILKQKNSSVPECWRDLSVVLTHDEL